MNSAASTNGTTIVIGASGQDGYFLTERLLADGWYVHAIVRRAEALEALAGSTLAPARLKIHQIDLINPAPLVDLIAELQPEEIYNLAGQSSVSRSFAEPRLTWATNADFVAVLLECVRLHSSQTRLYQASSTDMFGGIAGSTVLFNEDSVLSPQSPYASAKAAAHLLCGSYREAYNLRIACGILSNHESHRRPPHFLTRKITDHVRAISRHEAEKLPLQMGNLKVQRDWGFAPDYADGMRLVLRQISKRAERARQNPGGQGPVITDEGRTYRDYALGTGDTHAVWQLVDAAFRLANHALDWHLEGDDPVNWGARFRDSGKPAVEVDASLLRPSDPLEIRVDTSRARADLGWSPRTGLEVFLRDMLDSNAEPATSG